MNCRKENSIQSSSYAGIIVADGPRWVEQRRFSLQVLRDFGFGRFVMEDAIRAELADLVAFITASSTQHQLILNCAQTSKIPNQLTPIDPSSLLNRSIANVISQLVFGARLGGNDPGFERAADYINNVMIPKQKVWQIVLFR